MCLLSNVLLYSNDAYTSMPKIVDCIENLSPPIPPKKRWQGKSGTLQLGIKIPRKEMVKAKQAGRRKGRQA